MEGQESSGNIVAWIKFEFGCFISTKKLNEVLFSPVDILILECIFLICPYLEINYLQQLLLVDRY